MAALAYSSLSVAHGSSNMNNRRVSCHAYFVSQQRLSSAVATWRGDVAYFSASSAAAWWMAASSSRMCAWCLRAAAVKSGYMCAGILMVSYSRSCIPRQPHIPYVLPHTPRYQSLCHVPYAPYEPYVPHVLHVLHRSPESPAYPQAPVPLPWRTLCTLHTLSTPRTPRTPQIPREPHEHLILSRTPR